MAGNVFRVNPQATQTELHDELEMLLTRIEALAISQDQSDIACLNEELAAAYMGTIQDMAARAKLIGERLRKGVTHG